MKKVTYLLSMLTAISFLSCGQNKNSQDTISQTDSVANSVVEADYNANEMKQTEDELNAFIGDGATFDVRGHVKSVDYTNFDENGQVYSQVEMPIFKRNQKGQIIEIDPCDPGEHPLFTYNSNGRVSQMVNVWCEDECSKETYTYTYDSDGFVSSYTKVKEYTGGNYCEITNPKTFTCKFMVKVIEKDSHNNWIKRKITGEDVVMEHGCSSAEDVYAGIWGYDEEEAYYVKKNVEEIEERKITYYK